MRRAAVARSSAICSSRTRSASSARFAFGGHLLAVFGQLVGGEVALLVGGAGEDLLRGLAGGVAPLAELIKKWSLLGQPFKGGRLGGEAYCP